MSPIKWFVCFVLFFIASCDDMKTRSVQLKIETVSNDIEILVTNKSSSTISFNDHLFGGMRDPKFLIEVRDSSGMRVELCGSIEIFRIPRIIELPTGKSVKLNFPISFVVSSYCLQTGENYMMRVGFISKNGITDYSAWMPYKAEMKHGGWAPPPQFPNKGPE